MRPATRVPVRLTLDSAVYGRLREFAALRGVSLDLTASDLLGEALAAARNGRTALVLQTVPVAERETIEGRLDRLFH